MTLEKNQLHSADEILGQLQRVETARRLVALDSRLAAAVQQVKATQVARFRQAYSDVLADPLQGPGAEFFLSDLYGTADYSARDAQFARVVPALVRLFPQDVVATVADLAELHALSEELDLAMGEAWLSLRAGGQSTYRLAWRLVGRRAERDQQVRLVVSIGESLVAFTRNRMLRQMLRMMRGPAHLAGLGALQEFLERGFDTFASMRNPEHFLNLIAVRERLFIAQCFDADDSTA